MSNLISKNSDFLFIYEASLCNPNGDPDMENKPRMDYDTKTNLVTDTRLKRYIRDLLKAQGDEIFVDMDGTNKVSVDTRLVRIISQMLDSEAFKKIEKEDPLKISWNELREKVKYETDTNNEYWQKLRFILSKKSGDLSGDDKKNKKTVDALLSKLNDELLFWITKNQFIDIRMFGSAVAVAGFPRTITGAIQLNWGYSLNEVELLDSNSIVTIMNDDSSTFGKDYRVKYSLLAFQGSINKYAAKSTGLTDADVEKFRKIIWQSVSALPTRSKINQYPKAYVEIIYNDGFSNGHFGDLRNLIECSPKGGMKSEKVKNFYDLALDVEALKKILANNTGKDKAIEKVNIQTSPDFPKL